MRDTMSYGAAARCFHWLTVALLLPIIPIGLLMGGLPRGPLQDTLFATHESLGLTVLALTLARLMWRLTHRPPPSTDLNRLELFASSSVHIALYGVLFALPLTGYLFVTFRGIALDYFGLVEIPALVGPDKALGKFAGTTHFALQWAIYGLALMHIGAALHHHVVRHNDVLARMVPAFRRSGR